MTVKEAILSSLDAIKKPTHYAEVTGHIIDKGYYDFGKGKTPADTVSALLGDFIRNGDSRVKRIRRAEGRGYSYYLAKHEAELGEELLTPPSHDSSLLR